MPGAKTWPTGELTCHFYWLVNFSKEQFRMAQNPVFFVQFIFTFLAMITALGNPVWEAPGSKQSHFNIGNNLVK